MFPSPCGVKILKLDGEVDYGDLSEKMFPSPCGVKILKLSCNISSVEVMVSVPLRGKNFETDTKGAYGHKFIQFPSPCGVKILKQSSPA